MLGVVIIDGFVEEELVIEVVATLLATDNATISPSHRCEIYMRQTYNSNHAKRARMMAPTTPPTAPPTMALVSEDPDEDGVPVGTSTLVCVSRTVVNAVEVPEVKMTVPSEVNEDWNVTVVATAVVSTNVVVDVGAEDVSDGEVLSLEQEVVKSVAVAELDVIGTVITTGTWIVVVPPAVNWGQ